MALFSYAEAVTGGVIVQMPEKATVVGPAIYLGEITDVACDNSAVAEKIRRVTIGKAAPAGDKIKITLGYIKVALRREGYSLNEFSFNGEDATEVLTRSQDFDPATLLGQIKDFVLKQTQEPPENVQVTLEGKNKHFFLPDGEIKAKFRPSFSGKYEGTVFLTAELEVSGRLIRVLPLRITVDVSHEVVTTTKNLEKGQKFTKENLALVKTSSSKVTKGCFKQLNYVLGRTAAMPLPVGWIVRVSDIYDPPVIRHGQMVQAIVQKGNVELTVQVRAVEDGKAGDSIRIENTESHKILRGKVLDEKTILVGQDEPKQETGVVP